jgi:signal transduction histidine kinase
MEAAEGIEELSGIIAEGLNRTHRLVANLRDLGSPSDVDRKPIDLRQVVESALQLTRYFLQKRGVAAEVNVPAELPPVIGDSGALSQVVLNLLKNAAEALETSSEGKIAVEIHAENAGVLLTVSDNGPGVPESVAGRLYEPFVTTKSAGEGTGLGLSICKRIVEEHRGTIETMSAPSGGTQVSVWLPSEAVHES